ncbi:fatty acid cis/trans isomerase, partial [Klebsiella pneumoniae]|nr:fatty acid cis/trans isomerase [Klebsiella pneumoniae]
MEAEELFLMFIPTSERLKMREIWYKGYLTELKMKYVFPLKNHSNETGMTYDYPKNAKEEFLHKFLFTYLK